MPNDIEQLTVSNDNHVNPATLELLQRRIESEVRNSFLKTVTLPIGGGGVAAIIVAVLLWVPQKVDSFLKDPGVQETVSKTIQQQVSEYLKMGETQTALKENIREQTSKQIQEEVKNQLPAEVKATVAVAVKAYFDGTSGKDLVQREVDAYLKGDGKKLLFDKVDELLRPVAEQQGKSINHNRKRFVIEFEAQALHQNPKASDETLRDYLETENVQKIKKEGRPLVLTKTIRSGNLYYARVIRQYLNGFRNAFGDQLQYVSISYAVDDEESRLLALVPAKQFDAALVATPKEIETLLNDSESEDEAREKVEALFDKLVTRRIAANHKLGAVLTNRSVWCGDLELDRNVAVVDAAGGLIATTTRRHLIEGLFE